MNIKETRESILATIPTGSYKGQTIAKLPILADTFTYIAYTYPHMQKLLTNKQFINSIINEFHYTQSTFELVLQKTMAGQTSVKASELKLTTIIRNIKGLDQNPLLKSAIYLYLLKGSFCWQGDAGRFYELIKSNNNLKDDAGISCLDALLYGLLKGKFLKKSALLNMYELNEFSEGLGFHKAQLLPSNEEWVQKAKKEAYLLFIDKGVGQGWGLYHNMLSVPYSELTLLKIIIEKGIFDTTNETTGTVFSLWVNLDRMDVHLARLGTLAPEDVRDYIKDLRIHILPVGEMRTELNRLYNA